MTLQLLPLQWHAIVATLYCMVNAVSLESGGVLNARQQKAEEIATRAKMTHLNGCYRVPRQASGARHQVALATLVPSCTCKDFELRGKDCQHILAVRLWLE